MPDLDTILQDFASFIEEELPPPDVERVLSAAAMPPAMLRRWLRPVLVTAASAMLVLVVVGLPVLFLNGDESIVVDEPSTTVASTTVAPTMTSPTTVQPTPAAPAEVVPFPPSELAVLEVPLSEAIPGFTDTIVMSAYSTDAADVDVMRWRSSESMPELLLSLEGTEGLVGLDASARWASLVSDAVLAVQAVPTVPAESFRREIVGLDVQNADMLQAVWHDTEPGWLAWLECPNSLDGPATLVTLNVSDPAAEPIRLRTFDQGCAGNPWGQDESDAAKPFVTLDRWANAGLWVTKWAEDAEGDVTWGFDASTASSVLVDADGTEIATVSGARMMATSPGGTSIWGAEWGEPCFVLSPDGQQRSAVPGVADGEFLHDAYWSPDGTRLALFVEGNGGINPGEEVLRVVDVASDEIVAELGRNVFVSNPQRRSPSEGIGPFAWSTDNRFLLYSPYEGWDVAPGKLVFYDIATNTTTMVPTADDLKEIRVQ